MKNEQSYWSCDDPETLFASFGDRLSRRKARLFACACCRQVEHLFKDRQARQALATAERYADGQAPETDRAGAVSLVRQVKSRSWGGDMESALTALLWALMEDARWSHAAEWAAREAVTAAVRAVRRTTRGAAGDAPVSPWELLDTIEDDKVRSIARRLLEKQGVEERGVDLTELARRAEQRAQCDLFRDLLGNPFRLVAIPVAWRAWREGCAVRLAATIYEQRSFQELPILGDALEEAGCTDPVVLGHCRTPAEHARGCWLLDALLEQH
jgi:hypothetical protein